MFHNSFCLPIGRHECLHIGITVLPENIGELIQPFGYFLFGLLYLLGKRFALLAFENDQHPDHDLTKVLYGFDLHLAGIPQQALLYNYLTASATVDGIAVEMRTDNGSANAAAQLKVVNNPGFDLPDTGDNRTMIFSVAGVLLMACSAVVIVIAARKKKHF